MSFESSVAMFQGKQGKYYMYNGYRYDIHFPLAWALDSSIHNCGPEVCSNCDKYCYVNNVFVGYCWNCAAVFNDTRGCAAFNTAVYKSNGGLLSGELILFKDYSVKAINDLVPYMKGIKVEEIGDEEKFVEIPNPEPTQEEVDAFYSSEEKYQETPYYNDADYYNDYYNNYNEYYNEYYNEDDEEEIAFRIERDYDAVVDLEISEMARELARLPALFSIF